MSRIKKLLIFLTLSGMLFIDAFAGVKASMLSVPIAGIDTIKAVKERGSVSPDEVLTKKAMFLAFEMAFQPYDLPISLFDLKGVQKISIKEGTKESFVAFNQEGQWIKAGSNRDTVFLTYKNGAPDVIRNEQGILYEFHYAGDTLITVHHGKIDLYLLEGDFLLKRKTYLIDKSRSLAGLPFRKGTLCSSYTPKATAAQGLKLVSDVKAQVKGNETECNIFGDAENMEPPMVTELSNTHWEYPFHASYKVYDHSVGDWKVFKKEYEENQEGNLCIKYLLDNYTSYIIFLLEQNRPVRMLSSFQTFSNDTEPKVTHTSDLERINFTYTLFEK